MKPTKAKKKKKAKRLEVSCNRVHMHPA